MNGERCCPACGSCNYKKFAAELIDASKLGSFSYASRKNPEFMRYRLVCCTCCDLVYAPTPPASDALSDAYANTDYDSRQEAEDAARTYYALVSPHVRAINGSRVAVDVGAGHGAFLPWLEAMGFTRVLGIEPSGAAIDAASAAVRPLLFKGDFSRSDLKDLAPSLISAFMILEHLADPRGFLSDAYELLVPGGALAVVVHDWRAPVNRLLGMRSPIIDIEHLQLFSRKSLVRLLCDVGYQGLVVQAVANQYSLRYWLRLTPLPAGLKRQVLKWLVRLRLADLPLALNVGNVFILAFKPSVEPDAI